jgi:hypothetical protein
MVSQKFPHIDIIASSENHGYAKGVNEISKSHDWNYFLILNPDVLVKEDAIPIAMDFIRTKKDVSLLGANLVNTDGKSVHSWGELPSPSMFQYDFSGLRKWFPREKWKSTRTVTIEKEPFEAGYVTGAFMLIPRDAWDSVGPMDERFFLYFEDTDWAYRLKRTNRKAFVHPHVIATHESGSSFEDDEISCEYKMKCFFESAYKYFGKHFGEVERDIAFDRVLAITRLKLFILKFGNKDKGDAVFRQRMIIKIHRELAPLIKK